MTYVEIFVDNQVLVLDVAVRYALTIEVVDCFHDLREDITCLVLGKALVLALLDALEQVV